MVRSRGCVKRWCMCVQVCLLNYRKGGQPFWNQFFLAPVPDKQGVVEYYLGATLLFICLFVVVVVQCGAVQCSAVLACCCAAWPCILLCCLQIAQLPG